MGSPNAADLGQVRHARRKDRTRRERELEALRVVLSTYEGRFVIWALLGAFGFAREPQTEREIGVLRAALHVHAEIAAADPQKWLLMQQEALRRDTADAAESDAVRTASATRQGDNDE